MHTEIPLPLDHDAAPGYFFPGWIPKISKNRTLAYLTEEGQIMTEHEEHWEACRLDELHALAFERDLLLFVESILDLAWLEQAQMQGAILFATPKGVPTALQLHGKKNRHHCTRWIICSASWQQYTPNLTLLKRLRTLFDHCGVGTANTPSGLGMALQKRAFYETYGEDWHAHKHPLPPYRCVEDLRAMCTGARSEVVVEATAMIDMAYEIDMKNGYAAWFVQQPTGVTIAHQGRFLEQYATYVSHCTIEITEPLVLGCFAVRQADGSLSYPTLPGIYKTLLWKEEIEVVVKCTTCLLNTGPGWGWLTMTRDNARFAELMTLLRDTAPEEIVDWIKLAIVGSIGRHGSPWQSTILVPEGEQSPGDVEACWHGRVYDWYIHECILHIPESMQHWFSHTLMACRLALYQYALPFALKGQLLATNTDAVFVSSDADVANVVAKEDAKGAAAGTWRRSKLNSLKGQPMFPALRHVISQQKIRRPGVPKEK